MGKRVTLGERYRDTQTGIEGVAVARTEFQFGCERITLEHVGDDKKIEEYVFDAPRLEDAATREPIDHERRPGGNHPPSPRTGIRR